MAHKKEKEQYKKGCETHERPWELWEYPYIRTCPETHKHPTVTLTVNGRECMLPRPEVEAPKEGTIFWVFNTNTHFPEHIWDNDNIDYEWLAAGMIHLTEARARKWADWWENIVIKAIQER